MKKESFLTLLEARNQIRAAIDQMDAFGVDIESKIMKTLFDAESGIGRGIALEMDIPSCQYGDALALALEDLDKGEPNIYWIDGKEYRVNNYDELYDDLTRKE